MLIYQGEGVVGATSPDERAEFLADYAAFNEHLKARGIWRDGVELESADSATTVRRRMDRIETTGGPFAETKEQFAGFYVIECDKLGRPARSLAGRWSK